MHTEAIQAAIAYIEENLTEPLTVEQVASQVGLSKFYFLRLFKKNVGLPIYSYIKKRRLTLASKLLAQSSLPILEIALSCQFDSQEAFSRAFKAKYQLTPKKYRNLLRHLIIKEEPKMNSAITGWLFAGTASEKYQLSLDHETFHSGSQAAVIESQATDFQESEFTSILQQFTAEKYLGKRVRFSAFIKTENVTGWAGVWMRMNGGFSDTILNFDNMQNRPIQGTNDWNYYFSVLDVPVETALINIGVLLESAGKIWIDSAKFEIVDSNTPTTNWSEAEVYADEPLNLSFED